MAFEHTASRLRWLPIVQVVRGYRREWLSSDLVAGITVFAVLVPSALAYGELAGVSAVAGLYVSLVAMLVYAVVGTSRHMIVGPAATTSIVVAASIAPLANGDAQRYALLAAAMAVIVGGVCIAGSLFRLGFLTDFFSQPILTGYLMGTALIVMTSQLGSLFGISIAADAPVARVFEVVARLGETHWLTTVIGAVSLVLMIAIRRVFPWVPGSLVVLVLAISVSAWFSLEARGVAVVGVVPGGLPAVEVPFIGLSDMFALLPVALSMSLLVFADAVLTARAYARKHGYHVDANDELRAVGVVNLAAGVVGGFATASSPSRSAVNDRNGARSQLSGVIAAGLLGVFLQFFTGLLQALPAVILSVIIVRSASGLLDINALHYLYRVRRDEWWLAMLTLLGVLLLGIVPGILVAVTMALFNIIRRIYRPHDAVLDMTAGVDGYHDAAGVVQAVPGLLVYRFDAPIIYANASYFAERVRELVSTADPPLRWFVLGSHAITDLDTSGADVLKEVQGELAAQGVTLVVARAPVAMYDMLSRMALVEQIGADHFFPSVRTAVQAYRALPPPPLPSPPPTTTG